MNQQSELDETIAIIRQASPAEIRKNVEDWRKENRKRLKSQEGRSFHQHFGSVADKLKEAEVRV